MWIVAFRKAHYRKFDISGLTLVEVPSKLPTVYEWQPVAVFATRADAKGYRGMYAFHLFPAFEWF